MVDPTLVEIRTSFEGANPFQKKDAVREGGSTFVLYPFCEDDNTAYKFRLETMLLNRHHEHRKIRLVIDWRTRAYRELRDYVYSRSGNGPWEMLKAEVVDTRSILNLELHPGKTWVTLNPRYAAEDLDTFLSRVDTLPGINRQQIGETPSGRPLWMITAGSGEKHIMISARVHPYETAPSYITEGIIEYLAAQNSLEKRNEYTYYIFPMVAPDGVAQGLCRLSAKHNGVDLSREVFHNDLLTRTYVSLIDTIKPRFYLELHNWMFKEIDGMFYLNGWDSMRFKRAFNKHTRRTFHKTWRVGLKFGIRAVDPGGLKRYTQLTHGSKVSTLEIPWFQRSVDEMREFGKSLVVAVETLI